MRKSRRITFTYGTHCSISTATFRSPTLVSLRYRTSGFRLSVFRFHSVSSCLRLFTTSLHCVYQLAVIAGKWSYIQRGCANPQTSTSIQILIVEKMVHNITAVLTEYEERVRRLQKLPRFSHGRRMLRSDGAPNGVLFLIPRSPVIIFRLEL